MADFERAIALDANNAPAYLGRGLVYKARNQNGRGIGGFQQGDRARPRQFGRLLQSRPALSGRKTVPIRDRRLYRGKRPGATAGRAAARACAELPCARQAEGSGKDLDEAVQDEPQNAQAWITRGLAYERLGDTTGPPAPMAAPSICVPGTRRRVPALPASAASPGGATIRSDYEAVRFEAIARQSANCWRPPFPFCSCSLRQDRVEHRFGRRQHVLGNRGRMRRGVGRLGAQIKPRTRRRNFRRRNRPVRIVDRDRGRIGRVRGRRIRGFGRWRRQNDRRRQRSDHGRQCDRRRGSRRFS